MHGIGVELRDDVLAHEPDGLEAAIEIVSLSVPEKSKRTHLIEGAPAQAAAELVRLLREEARVL